MPTNVRTVAAVAAAVLVLDGLVKWWTIARLEQAPIDLGWIVLRSTRNFGVSFSLGAGLPTWVVTSLTLAATVAIVVLAVRGAVHPPAAAGLLVGGGVGNLVDRLLDGSVVDTFDLGWFPVFNVADVALNVGVGLVVLWALLHPEPEREPGAVADDAHDGAAEGRRG